MYQDEDNILLFVRENDISNARYLDRGKKIDPNSHPFLVKNLRHFNNLEIFKKSF